MDRRIWFSLILGLISLTACNNQPAPLADNTPESEGEGLALPEKSASTSQEDTNPTPETSKEKVQLSPMTVQAHLLSTPGEVPRTLPPAPSYFGWTGIVMRLEFDYREKGIQFLGTGFVVRDRTKQDYLLTCAHLIGEKEWQNRYHVKMRTMNGQRQVDSFGSTIHVGAAVDLKQRGPNRWPDMTKDLVIRAVSGEWAKPLPLSKSDPVVGEWVWAVGNEAFKPLSNEKLYLGQIVDVSKGGYVLRQYDRFDAHGFSGGPVINTRGEVIGNVLAAGGPFVSGATITVLRQRLEAKGIQVD
jgi:S1-C subfamily serine protease